MLNWCRYCGADVPARLTKWGSYHGTQPTHCSPEHAKRSGEWDAFLTSSRRRLARGDVRNTLLPPAGSSRQAVVRFARPLELVSAAC